VEDLGILPNIVEIEERLKRTKEQKLGDQNVGPQIINIIVKIGLKQEDKEEGIIVEALLDSGVTVLVIGLEFARKNNFKKKKLKRPIYEKCE